MYGFTTRHGIPESMYSIVESQQRSCSCTMYTAIPGILNNIIALQGSCKLTLVISRARPYYTTTPNFQTTAALPDTKIYMERSPLGHGLARFWSGQEHTQTQQACGKITRLYGLTAAPIWLEEIRINSQRGLGPGTARPCKSVLWIRGFGA